MFRRENNMAKEFPLISLEGSPGEIGLKHGKILKKRIEKTIAFYRKIFKKTEDEIFFAATHFRDCIKSFSKDYYAEIEGIAAGSGVDPLWIYSLNSRTEILNTLENECTAFYFPTSGVLSQNWDWAEDMEHLAVIMQITRPDGHKILQITEPGIIGKIGFNSAQIGVTLNFLHINQKLDGVPIHIILRTLLDAKSIDEGMRKIIGNTSGKSSNIIFADADGKYLNLEFAKDTLHLTRGRDNKFLHTNHFIMDKKLNTDKNKFASSYSRYFRAKDMLSEVGDQISDAKTVLLDKTNEELAICNKYVSHDEIDSLGTVCSIIMDLKQMEMHITRGNPFDHPFEKIKL